MFDCGVTSPLEPRPKQAWGTVFTLPAFVTRLSGYLLHGSVFLNYTLQNQGRALKSDVQALRGTKPLGWGRALVLIMFTS